MDTQQLHEYCLFVMPQITELLTKESVFIGSEWHPRIRNEQNHFIYNDLPRFIMDSYEECRDPPRLHLLDKYGYFIHMIGNCDLILNAISCNIVIPIAALQI